MHAHLQAQMIITWIGDALADLTATPVQGKPKGAEEETVFKTRARLWGDRLWKQGWSWTDDRR